MNGNANTSAIRVSAGISSYLWLMFVICFSGNVMGGAVSTLMSVYLPVLSADLLGPVDISRFNSASALINSLYLAGWTIGGFTWGVLGDRIGRSRSLAMAISMFGFFTLLTSFAHTWEVLIIYRFLSGFGVGGMLVINTTLLSEVWPERTRAIVIGIVSIGFPVGIFSSGAVNFIVSSWRQGFLTGIIPLVIGLISFEALKESEKWKTSRTIPAGNNPGKDLRGHRRDLVNGSVIFGSMLIGMWAIFSWVPTWVQSLLDGSDGQHERGLSMMVMGAGGLTGGFFSGWISNALGTRKAMLVCFTACFIMSFILFRTTTAFTAITLAEIALLACMFGISQGLLSVYIPLLFPVPVRATATGFCFNTGRIFTTAAVFFVGALVTILGGYGNSLFIFSFVFLLGIVFLLFSKNLTNS